MQSYGEKTPKQVKQNKIPTLEAESIFQSHPLTRKSLEYTLDARKLRSVIIYGENNMLRSRRGLITNH